MDARTLLVALLCLAVGVGVGWFVAGRPVDTPTALDDLDRDPDPGASDAPSAPALDSADAVVARLQRDLATLQAERKALADERDELMQELEALRADAEAGRLAGGAERSTTVRYPGGRLQEAMEAVDWEEAGTAISRMTPLLDELVRARVAGKPLPPSVGDIQKYNGALVKLALGASQSGVPGSGVNGAFTHVVVTANLVHATLKHAGLPLDEAQEAKLGALADDFLARDERRLAGYDERTPMLRQLLEETALKDAFYAGVDAILTEEQRNALHPAEIRGRLSVDLFSSGLVWAQRTKPVRYREAEDLRTHLASEMSSHLGLTAAQQPLAEEIAAEWVAGFPSGWLAEATDPMAAQGHFPVARVRTAATVQRQALERLLQRLPADDPLVGQVRGVATVLLPVKRTD